MKSWRLLARSALLAGCLGTVMAAGAAARTWVVAPDGSGDFVSIQDAIDAAVTGDEVRIRPGVYLETINTSGKAIDLIGEEGPDVTVVDGEESGSCLRIPYTPGGQFQIRGLSFTDGNGTWLSAPLRDGRFGGGVLIEVAAPHFEDCWIYENTANNGGGIFILSGSPVFTDCQISRNSAGIGAGISIELDSGARFEDCLIDANEGVFGAGAHLFRSRVLFERCRIQDSYGSEGGAVRVLESGSGVPRLVSCTLYRNYGDIGGAMLVEDGEIRILQSTLEANTSYLAGASIVLDRSVLGLESSVVSRRDAGSLFDCTESTLETDCVVLWARAYPRCIPLEDPTVVFADPLFCDPSEGDLTVDALSPCIEGHGPPGCGLIGAHGAGCGAGAVEPPEAAVRIARWGRIKALYR